MNTLKTLISGPRSYGHLGPPVVTMTPVLGPGTYHVRFTCTVGDMEVQSECPGPAPSACTATGGCMASALGR